MTRARICPTQAGRSPTMTAALQQNEEAMGILLGWPTSKNQPQAAGRPAVRNEHRVSAPLPTWKNGDDSASAEVSNYPYRPQSCVM